MDRAAATRILRAETTRLAARTYSELAGLVGDIEVYEFRGADGVRYQIEVEVHWVASPDGPVQVLASIDDGSFRSAFRPVTDSFVKSPATEGASSDGE
ncbi:MAG: hypothetical protein AB1Z67_05290 [Candidatus Limnocylindrales bacterium]